MAIFNNSDIKPNGTDTNTTIITAGAKFKGEIELSCNLYIDGEIEGTIQSSQEINVGKNGKIKGTIITSKLVVQGFVEGSVDASKVEIKAQGHIKGEISSNELIIEPKAIFEGNSSVKSEKPLKESATK